MQHGNGPHPRHTMASALRDQWLAESEQFRPQLIQQVEAAFDGVRLGDGISLHQARAMDDYATDAEIAAARMMDSEERWQEIPDEKLDRFSDTMAFMDAQGFRFYLPRFMLFALKHRDGSKYFGSYACESAIYWSDKLDTTGKFSLLTQAQRETIQAFAQFFRDAQ